MSILDSMEFLLSMLQLVIVVHVFVIAASVTPVPETVPAAEDRDSLCLLWQRDDISS